MPHRILLATISLLLICSSLQGQERASFQLRKVVIDPGHGGKDPGTISPDGKVFEKNITLSVSLKLGQLIKDNYPDVEVIYTRKTDIFIPLNERSRIANKHKADLFISIHVNGVISRTPSGFETFVMGIDKTNSNFEVTMLENSVIMLEGDDYSTKYEGFNLNDKKNHDKFAESIFNAFKEFKTQYEKGNDIGNYLPVPIKETDTSQQAKPAAKADTTEHFRVQILAVSKVLPSGSRDFKGRRDISYIKAGNLHKYTIGKYITIDEAKEAQSEIRKQFPQAFIIKVRNNTIVPLNN